MVEPFDLQGHLQSSYFIPKKILVVLFGMQSYQAVVYKDKDKGSVQADVPEAKATCDELKAYLKNFGVEDSNIFELHNPTAARAEQTYRTLVETVAEGRVQKPPEDFLIVHCFVGHSVDMHGT